MQGPVKTPSGDAFVQMLPQTNALSKVKNVEDFLGCCGNFFKFSYIVSAPLHMKGFFQFWAKEHTIWDRLAVSIDLLLHLTAWFTALGCEIWANTQETRGPNGMQSELGMCSLWALIVALSGILIAQGFAFWGQEAGKLFPSTYALIVGGAYTSIIFSIMWCIHSATWTAMVNQYDDDPTLDDNLKAQRHAFLWTIALKTCGVTCAIKNANFWGPCVIDEKKEEAEKTAQWYKKNNMDIGAGYA